MSYQIQYQQKYNIDLLQITTPMADVCLSLFGGQVLSFRPRGGKERLWVSDKACYDGSKAIRGGIPICWPWFGNHPSDATLPAHGLVRNANWQLTDEHYSQDQLTLTLEPEIHSACGLELSLKIKIGKCLEMGLNTINRGQRPRSLTCALHNYLAIDDILQTEITGLSGQYQDKLKSGETFATPKPYALSCATDNIHLCVSDSVIVKQSDDNIQLGAKGHDSYVVWNPWKETSQAMSDMDDAGYQRMVCVESAVTQNYVLLPGESHTLSQQII